MSGQRRRYLWVLWLLFLPLFAFAVYHAYSRWQASAFEAAPFTPDGPEVSRLRGAAQDANLVVCSLDAARADHLGCYGYPRDTTPNLDRLARQSLVFREHFTQYVSTKPSVASLLTSQYSDTHLATEDRTMLEGTFTLVRGLRAAGFRTVLFSSNPNASPGMGIGRDFQEIYDQTDIKPLVRRWEELTRPDPLLTLIGSWLKQHGRSRFFAYIHFDPPHQPYLQPAEMTALFAGRQPPNFQPGDYPFPVGDKKTLATAAHPPLPEWINLYDANLRYADWAVGELERLLKEAGVFEHTLFIVTADHGEAFGEHGYIWHERGVYDELTHIPLIVKWPGESGPARSVPALTESVDLLPTVFDLFRIRYPREGVQGRSLLPLIAGIADRVHDYVFCRSDGKPPSYLVRSLRYTLILYGNGKWRALYDLGADPGERHDIIAEQRGEAERLLAAFETFARSQRRPPVDFLSPDAEPAPLPEVPRATLTEEEKKRLRGLGYLR